MTAKKESKTTFLDHSTAKGMFIVLNDKGLHTRPSTELVKCAARFKSTINLVLQDHEVNAKSLLGILTLAANRGSRIRIEAEGADAEQAVESLIELAKNKFHINY
jgi:phosphocarrier protein